MPSPSLGDEGPTLSVTFHDLPGRPDIRIPCSHRSTAASPMRHLRSSGRVEKYVPRTISPTRYTSGAPPRDSSTLCVPTYSVGRLKKELVSTSASLLCSPAADGARRYLRQTDAEELRAPSSATQPLTHLQNHTASMGFPFYFPLLGERFIILQVNSRTPNDGELVGEAVRNVGHAIPGSPVSFRAFSAEADITVRFIWSSEDRRYACSSGPSSATVLQHIPGTMLLSELRKSLAATLALEGRRALQDGGWGLVMAVPMLSSSMHPPTVETFVITDDLERLWDINALRGAMPLAERWSPDDGVDGAASPRVTVTIFLHTFQTMGVGVEHRSPSSRSLRNPFSDEDVDNPYVSGRVSIHTRCASPDVTPRLVGSVTIHELPVTHVTRSDPRGTSAAPVALNSSPQQLREATTSSAHKLDHTSAPHALLSAWTEHTPLSVEESSPVSSSAMPSMSPVQVYSYRLQGSMPGSPSSNSELSSTSNTLGVLRGSLASMEARAFGTPTNPEVGRPIVPLDTASNRHAAPPPPLPPLPPMAARKCDGTSKASPPSERPKERTAPACPAPSSSRSSSATYVVGKKARSRGATDVA